MSISSKIQHNKIHSPREAKLLGKLGQKWGQWWDLGGVSSVLNEINCIWINNSCKLKGKIKEDCDI